MKKICLTTIIDDGFLIGFVGFWKSFITNNPWFNLDFVIFDVGLSDESKEIIKSYYDKVIFREVNYDLYRKVKFRKTHEKLQKTYYKLEVFSLFEYDRIIQMDMDIIVQGDIKEIFQHNSSFGACRTFRLNNDVYGGDFNSGVFVVNKDFLHNGIYKELIRMCQKGHKMPDQKTLNMFFKDIVYFLPKKYNCEKRLLLSLNENVREKLPEDMTVIHYVGRKPWEDFNQLPESERLYEPLNEIWREWYNKELGVTDGP